MSGEHIERIDTVLVEIEPGTALVFGTPPPGQQVAPFTLLPDFDRKDIQRQVATSIAAGSVAAQAAQAMSEASGLVRLAPETLAAINSGAQPIASGGYNIGVLAGEGGKFSSQVLWAPASAGGTAAVLASVGPAVTLLAIQVQLNEISKISEHTLAQTQQVLGTLRAEQWAELSGLDRAVQQAVSEAMLVGAVSTDIWDNVRAREADLGKQLDLFQKATDSHVRQLGQARDHAKRRDYLIDNGEAILQDAHGAVVALNAWFRYQALRASWVRSRIPEDPSNEVLFDKIVLDARVGHKRSLENIGLLLDALERELWIAHTLPGNRTLPFLGKRKSAREAAEMAADLSEALQAIGAPVRSPRDDVALPSTVCFGDDEAPDALASVLRWRMERDETVEAIAQGRNRLRRRELIVLTSERLLSAQRAEFERHGVFDVDVKVSDIRYVRRRADTSGARLDVVTRDLDRSWGFESTAAASGEFLSFVALLQRHMRVPDAERDGLREHLPPALEAHQLADR
ncbi:hypothetical protein [Demequina muriae]|uniref:Uncharacterized protein n=1 Tax=Demequina muriae TaxID=3051664 RepID=A0ABT8GFK3_9MICO|nr:hypothetical protein [Demequina sp. EGI L300058]MDN4479716.1 hypothetical protein [Demequina sp. EGI L300058]